MQIAAGQSVRTTDVVDLTLRCPYCRHAGVFYAAHDSSDIRWEEPAAYGTDTLYGGQRICPNYDCRGIVFVVHDQSEVLRSFPPELIDFDATALPENLLSTLEEALACHAAGAYRASALMVRRLLEELCDDQKAAGKDLNSRLGSLGTKLIPTELLQAANELRLLGNDAAHIEAKSYDKIGREEVEVAIELAKELLKAVYQYNALLQRLQGLKKT